MSTTPEHPNDTKQQAILRVEVQKMMDAASERNAEGERVEAEKIAGLAENVAKAAEMLLREPLSEQASLLLMDDGTVEWEANE